MILRTSGREFWYPEISAEEMVAFDACEALPCRVTLGEIVPLGMGVSLISAAARGVRRERGPGLIGRTGSNSDRSR